MSLNVKNQKLKSEYIIKFVVFKLAYTCWGSLEKGVPGKNGSSLK